MPQHTISLPYLAVKKPSYYQSIASQRISVHSLLAANQSLCNCNIIKQLGLMSNFVISRHCNLKIPGGVKVKSKIEKSLRESLKNQIKDCGF